MTQWLTVAEAVAHLRAKDPQLIRAAIKRGDIPAYKYGKSQIRLKSSDVDAWMEDHPVGGVCVIEDTAVAVVAFFLWVGCVAGIAWLVRTAK